MALANDLPRFLGLTLVGSAQPPPTLSVGQTTSLGQQTSYFSLLLPQTVMSRFPLVGLLSGTNLCPRSSRIPEINTIICRVSRPFIVPFTIRFSFDFFLFRYLYLMSRQTGQKLLITLRLLQSFRCQPVGRDLTFSMSMLTKALPIPFHKIPASLDQWCLRVIRGNQMNHSMQTTESVSRMTCL